MKRGRSDEVPLLFSHHMQAFNTAKRKIGRGFGLKVEDRACATLDSALITLSAIIKILAGAPAMMALICLSRFHLRITRSFIVAFKQFRTEIHNSAIHVNIKELRFYLGNRWASSRIFKSMWLRM